MDMDSDLVTSMTGNHIAAPQASMPRSAATLTLDAPADVDDEAEPALRTLVAPALRLLLLAAVVCGLLYPLAMTGVAQVVFPSQARGSLIERDGAVIGSRLIGQAFSGQPGYLWGRPSAAGDGYDASASGGANLGPTNVDLHAAIAERMAAIEAAHPEQVLAGVPVPVDLVTSSGSGLDPHISLAAAAYQLPRIARERDLTPEAVQAIIDDQAQEPLLGIWGERVVNVLEVNLALDEAAPLTAGTGR